ncbi:MAG: alpha/beta fold hydrolase [Chloroflexota bacterium]
MLSSNISTINLKDNRILGYAEFGDLEGHPVFYFTGGTISGIFAQVLHPLALQVGARLIAPDRPGVGWSGFQPGRTIGDWPNDVVALADSLGIGRFAVVSESGGAPYAAACALKMPERLTAAAIVSGISPFDAPNAFEGMSIANRFSALLMQRAPSWLLKAFYWPVVRMSRRDPEKLHPQLRRSVRGMAAVDQAIAAAPEFQQALLAAFCAAFQQGSRGPVLDIKLCGQPWGSWLQDIHMPVQLWHGDADRNAPVAMARYLESKIPQCRATFYANEGHVSVMANHGREIFQKLVLEIP